MTKRIPAKGSPVSTPSSDLRFYWPSVSGYQPDGSLSFRLTGQEGDCRFTGSFPVPLDAPDFPLWAWLHKSRKFFPIFFEERHIPALRQSFESGPPCVAAPADGIYVVTAKWSGPARVVENAFRNELTRRDAPLPVHFVETDSAEVDRLFPQLRPFLHGYGEVIAFENGKCDLFDPRGIGNGDIPAFVDSVYQSFLR